MPRWTTRHVARTRYDSRRPCSVFRWVNGPRAPGETTGCWEKSRELGMGNLSLPRGYRYYRSDFARLEVEWGRKRPVASPCLFFSECCFETVQLLLWESERASSSGETILDGIRLLFTGDWRIFINAFLTTEQRFLLRRRWISIRFIFNFQLIDEKSWLGNNFKEKFLENSPRNHPIRGNRTRVRFLEVGPCVSFDGQSSGGFKFPLRHCVISLIYDPLSRLSPPAFDHLAGRTKGSVTGRHHLPEENSGMPGKQVAWDRGYIGLS